MNYFAHGLRFVDRPYFLAGTAVPDWLSVVDRKVRMRTRNVLPFVEPDGSAGEVATGGGATVTVPDPVQAEVAAGVLQHLHDDQWFHETESFLVTIAELGRKFRDVLDVDDGFRAGFLGHISTELLLDAVLIEKHPGLLDCYYATLSQVDFTVVERAVNRMARQTTDRLSEFIPLFLQSEFLRDYADSRRLLHRLNQVMRRIKLSPLPEAAEQVLDFGRELVQDRADDLLPAERFVSEPVHSPGSS